MAAKRSEIYVGTGDREADRRSFTDVTDGLMWARRYRKVIKIASPARHC